MKARFITDCPLRRAHCGSCGILRTTLVIGKNGLCAPCLRAGADGIEYADHQRRVTSASKLPFTPMRKAFTGP